MVFFIGSPSNQGNGDQGYNRGGGNNVNKRDRDTRDNRRSRYGMLYAKKVAKNWDLYTNFVFYRSRDRYYRSRRSRSRSDSFDRDRIYRKSPTSSSRGSKDDDRYNDDRRGRYHRDSRERYRSPSPRDRRRDYRNRRSSRSRSYHSESDYSEG